MNENIKKTTISIKTPKNEAVTNWVYRKKTWFFFAYPLNKIVNKVRIEYKIQCA